MSWSGLCEHIVSIENACRGAHRHYPLCSQVLSSSDLARACQNGIQWSCKLPACQSINQINGSSNKAVTLGSKGSTTQFASVATHDFFALHSIHPACSSHRHAVVLLWLAKHPIVNN